MINLEERHADIIREILRTLFPDLRVCAFGSRTSKVYHPFSDLDLVIMTDSPLPRSQLNAARDALADSDLPIKVDLLDWSALDHNFQSSIKPQLIHFL